MLRTAACPGRRQGRRAGALRARPAVRALASVSRPRQAIGLVEPATNAARGCVDLRRDLVEWSECGIHAATLRRSTDSVHQVSGRRVAVCLGLVAIVIASCGDGSNSTAATTTAAAPTTTAAGATTTAAASASTSAAPSTSTGATTTTAAPTKTILQLITDDGEFTVLLSLLQAARMTDTLSAAGPITFIAPTDKAFAKMDVATLDKFAAQPGGDEEDPRLPPHQFVPLDERCRQRVGGYRRRIARDAAGDKRPADRQRVQGHQRGAGDQRVGAGRRHTTDPGRLHAPRRPPPAGPVAADDS